MNHDKLVISAFYLAIFVNFFFQTAFSQAPFASKTAPGIKASENFQVFVNGKELLVYSSPIPASYCSFNLQSPVDVIIKAKRDIKWVTIRPLTAGIKPLYKDSTIKIRLTKPQKLSIELNGAISSPLFLFANAPEMTKPRKDDKNIIYFEGNKNYYAGIIKLTDNQSVYIEEGAVVTGVIEAKGAKNIKIFGRGILDGSYNNRLNDSLFKSNPDTAALRTMKGTYHRFIDLVDCKNVTIEDLTLHNSTSWQIVPIHCDGVRISNVKIISDQASDDGTDIVRSKNVLIENCFYRTKDDCIAIKANFNYPREEGVDGVLIKNCIFWNALWGNGVEIGFELNAAEIKNITFQNCDIIHIEAGAAISIHNAGTGHVKNILFDNIRIEDARQKLFDFAIFRSQYSEDGTRDPEVRRKLYLNGAWDGVLMVPENEKEKHAQYRGIISHVTLKNIKIIDGLFPYSIFNGYDEQHGVENIIIDNLTVHGKRINKINDAKFYLEQTKNIIVK